MHTFFKDLDGSLSWVKCSGSPPLGIAEGQIFLIGRASAWLSCLYAIGVMAKGCRELEGSGGMGSPKLGQFNPK